MSAVLRQVSPEPQPTDTDLLSFLDGHEGCFDVTIRNADGSVRSVLAVYPSEEPGEAWVFDGKDGRTFHPTMRHAMTAAWREAML